MTFWAPRALHVCICPPSCFMPKVVVHRTRTGCAQAGHRQRAAQTLHWQLLHWPPTPSRDTAAHKVTEHWAHSMALLQRACGGLLRALSSAACSQTLTAAQCQSLRAFSTPLEPVPPAVTSRDISEEWYLRQRNTLTLGNRTPHSAVGVWIAPSAVVVGDVDLYDRVS